jgi:hypothetical protein
VNAGVVIARGGDVLRGAVVLEIVDQDARVDLDRVVTADQDQAVHRAAIVDLGVKVAGRKVDRIAVRDVVQVEGAKVVVGLTAANVVKRRCPCRS